MKKFILTENYKYNQFSLGKNKNKLTVKLMVLKTINQYNSHGDNKK